jgi:hypothetical protein
MIKKFDQFEDTTQTIKDILLELEDSGFSIEYTLEKKTKDYFTESKRQISTIKITNPVGKFNINDLNQVLERISGFLNKPLKANMYLTRDYAGLFGCEHIYIYDDERGIRNWDGKIKTVSDIYAIKIFL